MDWQEKYETLVASVEALADEWEADFDRGLYSGQFKVRCVDGLRALLVGANPEGNET